MGRARRCLALVLLSVAMAGPAMLGGCAEHVRVYDAYYGDYHPWNRGEVVYFRQWIAVTHRPYVEYRALPPREQQEYWRWRHSQR